jgi:autotransporter passenger strand-loop-strand repeat protein
MSGTISTLTVDFGGSATDTTIGSGGLVDVFGTAIRSTIENGGSQAVFSGGVAIGTHIFTGGTESIAVGGTLSGDSIAGGTEIVDGDLSGTISFSGTGGILELGPDVTLLAGTEIIGFAQGDSIILQGDTGAGFYNTVTGVLSIGSIDLPMVGLTTADTLFGAVIDVSGTASTEITVMTSAECFLAGTRIMTPRGAAAVETLRIGDKVLTAAGRAETIEWIGQRSYDARFAAGNHLVRPVRLQADAIAAGVPSRDLYISPGHGIFVDGVLIPAWRLINGRTITQPDLAQADISYFHIELASHAVILAENCPAETYLDTGARTQFQNAATYTRRADTAITPLPRVESGFALNVIKTKLDARAGIVAKAEAAAHAVIGYVDHVGGNTVSGWALCPDDPETPVTLDIYFWRAGVLNKVVALANAYRADLRQAGLGSGCHGFAVDLPDDASGVCVVRAADRTPLAFTEAAMKSLMAA